MSHLKGLPTNPYPDYARPEREPDLQQHPHDVRWCVIDGFEGACCAAFHADRNEAIACAIARWPESFDHQRNGYLIRDPYRTSIHGMLIPIPPRLIA